MLREKEKTEMEKYDEWAVMANEFDYDGRVMAREILKLRDTIMWMGRTIHRKSELLEEIKRKQVRDERAKGVMGYGREKIRITA